ncbi:MAG: class I SAM-dependent methyltransferase [Halobacteriovoraceae bacterium]|nr:class I SAM-dependent methyltransferase [Halobacteriovoraceae bacterium]
MIDNRLKKNYVKKLKIAKSQKIEAFRVYECDIPEFPYILDLYKNIVVIYDRRGPKDFTQEKEENNRLFYESVESLFPKDTYEIVKKAREKQKGTQQYNKIGQNLKSMIVNEGALSFKVNCYDYLDTGLFLDHRPLRKEFSQNQKDKKFLNLFCYTGAVSVAAAFSGAKTTNVDMSKTYINWAKDNFKLNKFDTSKHTFISQNVLEFLQAHKEVYDTIFLDPPTFSNSKKMNQAFEVEKDQNFLIDSCMNILEAQGKLFFSNNKRKFKLSNYITQKYKTRDITESTIPFDFHNKKIHNCYIIQK